MTPANVDDALHDASIRRDPPPDRVKAVLFCPDCGHEGHATADWDTRDDYVDGTRSIVCPECGARVTERPLPNRSANAAASGAWADTGARMPWETWRDLWRSSVQLLTNWPRNARCCPAGAVGERAPSVLDRSLVGDDRVQ